MGCNFERISAYADSAMPMPTRKTAKSARFMLLLCYGKTTEIYAHAAIWWQSIFLLPAPGHHHAVNGCQSGAVRN